MPTLTVKIASRGTVYNINEKSAVGHMWMSLDSDGFGGSTPAVSMGFAPQEGGKAFGKGSVHSDDDQKYVKSRGRSC